MPTQKRSSFEPVDTSAREKFYRAVYALATGEGDVRSRLSMAYLALMATPPSVLPEHLRGDFEWVLGKLTARPKKFPWEGRLDATLRAMNNKTGVKIAERIFHINEQLGIMDDEYRESLRSPDDSQDS